MSEFTTVIKFKADGYEATNKIEIRDEQCNVCLNWIIFNWYITKSFKRHRRTALPVCLECVEEQ